MVTRIIEASSLNLPPGMWPYKMALPIGDRDEMFTRSTRLTYYNQFVGYAYIRGNIEIHVLND